MATYRNSFTNYYSDKTGNHAPVGTILPVFADVNLGAEEADYSYPHHLYCDGKELFIRDYPELYSIIENRYGGSRSVAKTQASQPGGLRRTFIINNKLFFQFYHDSTNNKANVKLPYPYDSVLRFSTIAGNTNPPYGAFPSDEAVFNQNTFYALIIPTEDVTAQEQPNEFAYEVVLPDDVDLSTVPSSNYTKNFTAGDAHPLIIIQKSFTFRDYPYNIGTFNLPDYRNRKILGYGTVNGPGTSTPENAINNFVGQTGGQWYIAKDTLIDSGDFFVIGDVKTTGYTDITADISAYITGSVKYQIGPMDDYVFPFPPAHGHRILSTEVDETKLAEVGPTEVDKYAVNYINSRANISVFEPNGSVGGALGHSHGLIGRPLQNTLTATYGNTNGIGETAGDAGDSQYQYLVSESASVPVVSMTYDSNTGYITINTDGAHGLSVDDIVSVNGAAPSEYSGTFTIISAGFGNTNFNVLPRTGEIPASSPATGSITVKLANGYFAQNEVIDPPKAYVIDSNTIVGGKTAEFDIPGNSITIQETTIDTPNTAQNISSPPASAGTVTGMYITLQAPGGGGADSDNDGTSGGQARASLFIDGDFYEFVASGGGGGQAGAQGGAGGSGGSVVVTKNGVPVTLSAEITGASINITDGGDGNDGGYPGTGTNDATGAAGFGGGGDGSAEVKSTTNSDPETIYNSDGSWTIPSATTNEINREITVEISGGGGGPGNPNSASNCSSTWPGWPTTISGKTGANGGYGGRGTKLVGAGNWNTGTLSWELGEGGDGGWNVKQGSSAGGTPGTDPRTGQPYNSHVGGYGTGVEPYGATARKEGASGSLSGSGARGAWGNGGTGGSGGGVTGFYYNGTLIAGAGGGGGGGGSGGGFNGGGTTDGCYPGGDAVGPSQSLISTSGVLDVANGGNGTERGCTAGGGGGGGSSCGIITQAAGGSGGTAGVGHNGNGGGGGGAAGVSAYRNSFWSGTVTETINGGADPTNRGYVKISFTRTIQFYDDVGGGGGQGGAATIILPGINTNVSANLQGLGQGGGVGSDAASGVNGGNIFVQYYGQEEGTTEEGATSVPTGVYYECDPNGLPQGASFNGNVWISSTDDNIRVRQFGAGTGDDTGFTGGTSAIPFNSTGKITRYIPFTGGANEAGGKRQLEVGPFDTTNVNAIRFTIIRGSNTNGGENPDQALNVFYKKGSSNNVTLLNSILLATNSPQSPWQVSDIPIPENVKDFSITLIIEQDRGPVYQTAPATDDNYGLGGITLFYAPRIVETFVSTGGATLLGNLDVGDQPINSDDGIDQVRREVSSVQAAMTVTDGTFTMSSSTPITTTASVTAENNIPLITKYHRVKYLIKAL